MFFQISNNKISKMKKWHNAFFRQLLLYTSCCLFVFNSSLILCSHKACILSMHILEEIYLFHLAEIMPIGYDWSCSKGLFQLQNTIKFTCYTKTWGYWDKSLLLIPSSLWCKSRLIDNLLQNLNLSNYRSINNNIDNILIHGIRTTALKHFLRAIYDDYLKFESRYTKLQYWIIFSSIECIHVLWLPFSE